MIVVILQINFKMLIRVIFKFVYQIIFLMKLPGAYGTLKYHLFKSFFFFFDILYYHKIIIKEKIKNKFV